MIVDSELVIADGAERPPEGTPIRIEARDPTYVDVASPVVPEAMSLCAIGTSSRNRTDNIAFTRIAHVVAGSRH